MSLANTHCSLEIVSAAIVNNALLIACYQGDVRLP